ncbi:MAG TPA: D-glycero-beta-D-manno-heptose-7-phosphate kinase [Acidiferrobacteraceae bacterium]|nr:D-glycero-beta-D-manno-heptose-7-phosphate kinase [Acidiferrobacteraceae bacterium]
MIDLSTLTRARVMVVGDVMLDRYWFGRVDRISPEAPVPVVAVGETQERPGGAANVAGNVTALGASCILISVIGNDESGAKLTTLLNAQGVDCRLNKDPETSTTVKLRVMSHNQQLMRLDFESPPSHEILERCLEDYKAALSDVDIVLFSDYGKGGLAHMAKMISLAREAELNVIVDPKGRDYERYRDASMVTPNRTEFEDLVGVCDSSDVLSDRAHRLIREYGFDSLLLTRSEEGVSLYRSDGTELHCAAMAREVYDVTGAGDTVIAALAAALAAGADDEDALTLANTAAGIVVGKLGTASASRYEIEQAIQMTELT